MKGLPYLMPAQYGLTESGPGAAEHMFMHAATGIAQDPAMYGFVEAGNTQGAVTVGTGAIGHN